ncbi:hypothetical protein [Pseudoalteromonas sp. NBT06-2]|nr:hypothetical protein [Pseudoalteromonas sp. NBT06-2]
MKNMDPAINYSKLAIIIATLLSGVSLAKEAILCLKLPTMLKTHNNA